MKYNNRAVLRKELERTETAKLEEMLQEELKKEEPDEPLVREIGATLKERQTVPKIHANAQYAWARYQRKNKTVHKKCANSGLVRAASLVLILLTLVALVPTEAKAMNFFDRFMDWTEDVFALFSPAESRLGEGEYVFRTDNPGLQEVYDKVTELGVTVPVVPTWLPEGYELVECVVNSTPSKNFLTARFLAGMSEVVYQLDIYSDSVTYEYYKDDSLVREYEVDNTTFSVFSNADLLVAVWTIENIECSIFIDCQEDILHKVLGSIYTMEEN